MFKRALCAILIFALLGVSGCAAETNNNLSEKAESSSAVSETIYDDGEFVYTSESGTSVTAKELPHDLDYNGENIVVCDVAAFESQENYSYTLYIAIAIDCRGISDAQYHWLKESDLTIRGYLTSESNEYDFDYGTDLGNVYSDDYKTIFRLFSFEPSAAHENRHSFSGSEFYIVVSVRQDGTYEYTSDDGDTSNLHVTNRLNYNYIIPEGLDIMFDENGETGGFNDFLINYFIERGIITKGDVGELQIVS